MALELIYLGSAQQGAAEDFTTPDLNTRDARSIRFVVEASGSALGLSAQSFLTKLIDQTPISTDAVADDPTAHGYVVTGTVVGDSQTGKVVTITPRAGNFLPFDRLTAVFTAGAADIETAYFVQIDRG